MALCFLVLLILCIRSMSNPIVPPINVGNIQAKPSFANGNVSIILHTAGNVMPAAFKPSNILTDKAPMTLALVILTDVLLKLSIINMMVSGYIAIKSGVAMVTIASTPIFAMKAQTKQVNVTIHL